MKNILVLVLFSLLTCTAYAEDVLRMSTTTSTENSGLLAVLNSVFEKQSKIKLEVIAVGTGKAIKLGENGDVDLIFVHAPEAEKIFVEAGYGVDRRAVMHNDFVFIGPAEDPAGVLAATSATQVLRKLADNKAEFISRGDDSGTHKKEKLLWQRTGFMPMGDWYVSAGQGMGAVLRIADDKQAYTLTDRGTYLSYLHKTDLQIVFEGDDALANPYHIIAVNPERFKHVRQDLAQQYIDFVTSAQGQQIIKAFKQSGQQLFYPDVVQ